MTFPNVKNKPGERAKNISLRGEAGADKNEGGEGPLPKRNVSLKGGPPQTKMRGGAGLTFPNVKTDAGASTKAQ